MKKTILLASLSLSVIACKPIYKCGDDVPEKSGMMSKRMKAVVAERDDLCIDRANKEAENNDLIKQNTELNAGLTKKNADYDELEKKFENLTNQSISQAERFNNSLKAKSDELTAKENLLKEREKSLADLKAKLAKQDSITKRLNDILRNALLGFKSDELSVEIKNGKVYVSMSDKLLFKSGSVAVEDKGKEAIKLLADVLSKNQDVDVLIEGHTDNVPIKTAIYKDNWDLSVARATTIVRMLTEDYKLSPKRVTASGKGEFSPKASNDTAEGRAKNRRTEIILSPKLDEIMNLLEDNK